MHTREEKMAL